MKLPQLLLPFGCALVSVCPFLAGNASGQNTGIVPNRVTHVPDDRVRVKLAGNVHPLARTANSAGAVADSLAMERILLLIKRSEAQEVALRELLEAQQDKSSANYHKWLTPEEFGKQFGPSDADLQAVTDWLNGQGFQNVRVAAGRNVVEFSGSAGRVKQAFGTQMQNYQVNGSMYLANADDPEIPAALAPVVAGVVSLHNFPRKSHSRFIGDVRKKPGNHKLEPLFTFPSPYYSGNFYGVGPGDFATIYNTKPLLASGNDGSGQTIAIVGETQINPKDVSDFRAMFGLPDNFQVSNIVLNGMDPGITSLGEESESNLDVQWSGAVAPGATVKFVVSASTPATAGVDLSALYIVENNLADVMSESYGECEAGLGTAGNAFYNELWEQAAAQGITAVVSSGDGGSAGCDDFNNQATATHGLAVSGLSGTPFNVSVGGTDFNQYNVWTTYWNSINDNTTGTSAKGYIPEFPWNQNCSQLGLNGCGASAPNGSVNIVAGGGGASKVYSKPKWQMGVTGVPNDNHRDQPDISLFASPGFVDSGYLFCQADLTGTPSCNLSSAGYTFHVIGGTSASAPAFAGIMALVNQYAAAHGGSSRQGNANVNLYALAKNAGASCTSSATPAAGCIFNDVVKGNIAFAGSIASNSVACKGGSLNCSVSVASSSGVLVDPAHTTTEAWTAGAGYDLATGLGSLNVNNLATNWTSASTIATTTTLTLAPTTGITHGQTENVAVTVNVKPNTGTGIASGDVALLATLADGSTLGLDQFKLVNGAVTSTKTQNLPGGTYNVYAHYAGDGTNAPSDSASVQVTVGKEASQTFIVIPTFDSQGNQTSGSASSLVYGSNYIIRMYVTNSSATASANGPPSPTCSTVNQITCPTGTISLTANGVGIDGGTFTLNNEGYTRDIAPTLTGGTYPLVAKYSGDSSYTTSTSATDTITVTPAPSQTNFDSTNFYTLVGQPLGVSVFANVNVPGGAPPTGTFSFLEGTNPVSGTISVSPGVSGGYIQGGIAAVFNSVGKHSITATYSGDANYASSTTSTPMIVYAQYPTTVAISADSTNLIYGQSANITATVTSSHKSPTFAGSLSFYSPFNATMGPVTTTSGVDGSGNQILKSTFTYTPQTSAYINANYDGDTNYANGSSFLSINVTVPDFSLNVTPNVSVIAGQSGATQISVQPATNYSTSVALSCGGALPVGYSCSFAPPSVSLANGVAVSSQLMLSPAPASNAIRGPALRSTSLWRMPGNTGRFPLSVLGLTCGLAALLACRIRGRIVKIQTVWALAVSCMLCLTIGCGGGGGNSITPPPPANPGPTATTLVVSTSGAKTSSGTPVTFTANVSGQGTPTGTVSFFLNGSYYCQGTLAQALATCTTTVALPGLYTLTATYSGDASHLASTAAGIPQTITGSSSLQVNAQTGPLTHVGYITVTLQ
jgi:subtilase family serine protease